MDLISKITDEITILEDTLSGMELQLDYVLTPSLRRELLLKIEDIRDSIKILREDLNAIDTWDQQNIFDK